MECYCCYFDCKKHLNLQVLMWLVKVDTFNANASSVDDMYIYPCVLFGSLSILPKIAQPTMLSIRVSSCLCNIFFTCNNTKSNDQQFYTIPQTSNM